MKRATRTLTGSVVVLFAAILEFFSCAVGYCHIHPIATLIVFILAFFLAITCILVIDDLRKRSKKNR